MKIRKNKTRSKPAISTASLPDIIFMLLFFFMVVTVMRPHKLKLNIRLPAATEIQKLQNKSLINYIHIGKPIDPAHGTNAVVQINDAFVAPQKVEAAMRQLITTTPERLQPLLTTTLKVDQKVQMGVIDDVKTALRKANQLKINYEAIAERD